MVAFDTPTTSLLMDIWVDYEVELVTPVFDEPVVLNIPLSGHTAVTDLTTASGTHFFGPLNATTPYVSNALKVVSSGLAGVPILSTLSGGVAANLKDGLDISTTDFKGVIDFLVDFAVTGVTPATIIGTNQPYLRIAAIDSDGNQKQIIPTILSNTPITIGPSIASELSTNSKYVRSIASVSLNDLKLNFPQTRYLSPYIESAVAALGAGYQAFGWRWTNP